MRQPWKSISQCLRLPIICALCNEYHRGFLAICDACQLTLPTIGPACFHCALPLPEGHFLICGHCCKNPPIVDHVIAAYRFDEPLRRLLHEFKYYEGLYLSSFLASLMTSHLSADALSTECLIPIPLHPKRLRERGFNQAAELTKHLSRTLQIPYNVTHCIKIIHTPAQAHLNAHERQKNLQKAFKTDPLPYEHVTLIDDLLTTGSTVHALANLLKQQGIRRVDVWCCARVISSP